MCPWCHQQNFIPWIKLYCKRGHVTKVGGFSPPPPPTILNRINSNHYRLIVQSSDFILKWFRQECFRGNLSKVFKFRKYRTLHIFKLNLFILVKVAFFRRRIFTWSKFFWNHIFFSWFPGNILACSNVLISMEKDVVQ